MNTIRENIMKTLKSNRETILQGGVNCIPSPFVRFRSEFPGIRRKFSYLISGATKSSKTQLTNYLFIINSIFYYIKHPTQVKPIIHMFPLEETKEDITLRFYAYVINYLTKGEYALSPEELESVDERSPVPIEVLDLMESKEFVDIIKVYEESVIFHSVKNPTGIYKTMKEYLEKNGTTNYTEKVVTYKDDFGITKTEKTRSFESYVPNNPNEYVMFIVDHVGLLQQENNKTLKETIEKLSEYCVILRNNYSAIPILVQQQNSETTNLDAFKASKIRPTKDGLKDSKRTGEDCTVLLGITNPHSFELPNYLGYDIKTLGGAFRVLEVVLARKGKANGLCPLYFNGAINEYKELPRPDDVENITKVYQYIKNNNVKKQKSSILMLMMGWLKKKLT